MGFLAQDVTPGFLMLKLATIPVFIGNHPRICDLSHSLPSNSYVIICIDLREVHDMRRIDLSHQRFGNLTALFRASNQGAWVCRCECGMKTIEREDELRNGSVHECGFCQLNKVAEKSTTSQKKHSSRDLIQHLSDQRSGDRQTNHCE